MTDKLLKARKYEEEKAAAIKETDRPAFHLTPRVGWMNDPNGFSLYKGEYHMFYQYHPYRTYWGPMHWGHAVSKDLLHWTYRPCAMANDTDADDFGVFSGSAIELPDGRQLLMYTGVTDEGEKDGEKIVNQRQCIAIGDGTDYEKYVKNPVIDENSLPEGASRIDFRDPKIVRNEQGTYTCYIGSRPEDGSGQILTYESEDAVNWTYKGKLIENNCRVGLMWECPDVFRLNGKDVLFASPQDMRCDQVEGISGNGNLAVVGTIDPVSGALQEEWMQTLDQGIDFYAQQTVLTPDGRRVMIGWMQNWDACEERRPFMKWFGQMTMPRELSIRNGRIWQAPIREIEEYRSEAVQYENVPLGVADGEKELEGISGRLADLTVLAAAGHTDNLPSRFEMKFAADDTHFCSVIWRPKERTLTIDRSQSGTCRALMHTRSMKLLSDGDSLKLRLILDRYSAEIFFNDGEQTMTFAHYSDLSAEKIRFSADGDVSLSVEKYSLNL